MPNSGVTDSPGKPWPSLRIVAALFAVALVALIADAAFRERGDFDYALMRPICRIGIPGFEPVLRFVSQLTGSFWAITLWAAMLAAFLVFRRWLEAAAMAAFPAAGAVNSLIRAAVGRSRPDFAELKFEQFQGIGNHNDYVSFPSGHVVGAVLLYGFLFILAREIRFAPARWLLRAGAAAIILLAGVARVWLGAHWVGDVLAGYALGGLALLVIGVMYRDLAPTVRGVPLIRAGFVPHDDSLPHAHALTSTILFRAGEVTKVYNPGFVPRMIYWLAFQARFAYAHNPVAIEAAVLRRNLAGKLTEYWFGVNSVAEALRADTIDGRLAITGRFTDGVDPRDHHRARQFLFELADRFDAAGLPTWQIDPRQPRSLGNLLELADGSYRIIDLESGLVSPLASPRAWWRAFRRGLVPIYDDVYFDLTRAYVEREAPRMAEVRGDPWVAELRDLLDRAEERANTWHRSEPRIWACMARLVTSGFGLFALGGWIRGKRTAGESRAQSWLHAAVDGWEADGRIDADECAGLRASIDSPEIQNVLPHFGVHLLIAVALRFPIGSIARITYTTGNLVVACVRFAARKIDHDEWRMATRIHSPLVILVAAMPGIGTFSYLVSGPVRSNRMLLRLVLDMVGDKIPLGIYRRLGLKRIIAGRSIAPASGIATTRGQT